MVVNVATSLSIEESFDLSLCCHHFRYLITEDRFCKKVIRAKAKFSLEAREAGFDGRYARALRRLVRRRRAIAEARPYVVAIGWLVNSHVLSNGKLCYVQKEVHEDVAQGWLRILDLHNPSGQETVGLQVVGARSSPPEPQDWLLILDTEKHELAGATLLESTIRLFVRNSGPYLYYGTHSEYGADGYTLPPHMPPAALFACQLSIQRSHRLSTLTRERVLDIVNAGSARVNIAISALEDPPRGA
ncbi:peptide transporter [Apiospora arundinis]